MPTDDMTLIGLGLAGLFIVWLAFSLLKKVVGLAVLAALIIGGFVLWSNPEMRRAMLDGLAGLFG
jgi:hypothetical protein